MISAFPKASLFQILLLSTSLFFMVSCENRAGKDPKDVAEERNEDMDKQNGDMSKERDEDFLIKAAEINMEGIQLGQLAQQKGTLTDVKELAKTLTDEHTKAMSDLSALAGRKAIAIPTATTDKVQNAYNKLNEKTVGNDFDKEYCDMTVKGHNDAINAFERAASNAYDADIKAWASSMLPGMRMHLEKAKACEEKLKQM